MVSSLIVLFSLPLFAGKIIHVPADQPTIQAGIDAASNGDTVLVSPGTYKENISFNGKAITVTSQSGPAVTIIDGQQLATVVTFTGGETRKSIIRGFTIQNGSSDDNGGGVSISEGSPTIAGNILAGNSSCWAAAIGSSSGTPLIQDNVVTNNAPNCAAAAINISSSTGAEVVGNIISNNLGVGLQLQSYASNIDVKGNTVANNGSIGVYLGLYGGTANVVQNVVAENGQIGLTWTDVSVTFINNTVLANSGEACCFSASDMEGPVSSQTIVENNLVVGTGVLPAFSCDQYDSDPVFLNNDVYGTQAPAYGRQCPDFAGSNGNISADPLFVDPFGRNYHIQSTSPAINAGSNSALGLPGHDFDGDKRILGQAVDIGADEYSPKTTLALSAYNLQYGSEQVGQASAPQTVTLANHGTGAIAINQIAASSDFSQTNNCGTSLAAGGICQINISFAPIGGGLRAGVIGIFTNATLNPVTVGLRGTGLAPIVQLDTTFIQFYQQAIGTQSQQTDNLTNIGQAPLAITNFELSGSSDFTQTNNCPIAPNTLAVGAVCTITAYYSPTVLGYEDAGLRIYDNAEPNPQTIDIDGVGVGAGIPTLSPDTLTFPTTLIGSSSDPQYSTLTNTGAGALGNIVLQWPTDFPATSDCPGSLAPGASCTITVTFDPSQQGEEDGTIYVANDSPYYGQLSVSGSGEAAVPAITSLSISNAPAGSPDTSISITGTGFFSGSQVYWNGTYIYAYAIGNTQLIATVPSPYLATPGTAQITVVNPSPGGGTSNPATFIVYNPINYAVESVPYRYQTITGTNLDFNFYYAGWITSPFPIQFGGGSYTNLEVDAGGNLSVVASGGEYNQPIPDMYTATIIAPFWAPLYSWGTGTDNNVFWEVTGAAPNRRLVIEWRDVSLCCDQSGLYTVKFQVVFAENQPEILFNYADTVFGGPYSSDDDGATATVGIQLTPTVATQYSYDTPSLASNTSLLWYPSSPTVTLSTSSLDFGYHVIGTRSTIQTVTLTNGGVAPLHISGVAIDNPDFAQGNNCGHLLKSGHSCTISVAFTPSVPTLETGTLTITDNAPGGYQNVSLSGIGTTSQVVIFPPSLNFGNVAVGQTRTLPVTVANAANSTMTIEQIITKPDVFSQSNNCGNALEPGTYCTINVTFAPVQKGSVKGGLGLGINHKPTQPKVAFVGAGS